MVTVLRPLSTSELLDRTFHLYRNNFVVFVAIAALPQLAVLTLQLVLPNRVYPRHVSAVFMHSLEIWLASFIAVEIAHAATVMAVSNLHLGRAATIASAYSQAKPTLVRVVGISLAVLVIPMLLAFPVAVVCAIALTAVTMAVGAAGGTAVAVIGSIFIFTGFVLAGLKWWLTWALVVPVTVLEGGGLRASMRRSKNLTQGRRGRIFVIYLLIAILAWVVSVVIQSPMLFRMGWRAFRHPTGVSTAMHVMSVVGAFVSASLVAALGAIALTLIYYDERVRKEGFDLQLMVSSLEGTATSVAAAPAS